jgi:hypothetical protein
MGSDDRLAPLPLGAPALNPADLLLGDVALQLEIAPGVEQTPRTRSSRATSASSCTLRTICGLPLAIALISAVVDKATQPALLGSLDLLRSFAGLVLQLGPRQARRRLIAAPPTALRRGQVAEDQLCASERGVGVVELRDGGDKCANLALTWAGRLRHAQADAQRGLAPVTHDAQKVVDRRVNPPVAHRIGAGG